MTVVRTTVAQIDHLSIDLPNANQIKQACDTLGIQPYVLNEMITLWLERSSNFPYPPLEHAIVAELAALRFAITDLIPSTRVAA